MCSLPLGVSLGMTFLDFVVLLFWFHLAYLICINSIGKTLGRQKKKGKKKRTPVNSSKCKRSITVKSEVTAAAVRL